MKNTQKGFTLIELLIVIVIIGILAGVLIAIINPAQQQNRARDANVKATMNKVVLATQGFISAYGRAPNDVEFLGSLSNAADVGPSCANADAVGADSVCNFTVTGNALVTVAGGVACNANTWSGDGDASNCAYHYYREGAATNPHFRVAAKSYGIASTVFLYDNLIGEITDCAAASISDTTTADTTDGSPCD